MADLIKKIKIKRQDGTYTNYIPIGVDAVNAITDDGESVQLKLNKKPYYFDTVADMRNAKLKNGDFAITAGFYEVNDGGGAKYKVRKITNEDIINNMVIIALNDKSNELIAELITNKINIKQIGARGDGVTDDTKIIQYALSNYENVYIPNGEFLITNTLQMNDCKKIIGNNPIDSIISCNNSNIDILKMKNGNTAAIEINNIKFKHETIGGGNGIVFGDHGV